MKTIEVHYLPYIVGKVILNVCSRFVVDIFRAKAKSESLRNN